MKTLSDFKTADGGTLAEKAQVLTAEANSLGLVLAAVFVDLNGDGNDFMLFGNIKKETAPRLFFEIAKSLSETPDIQEVAEVAQG